MERVIDKPEVPAEQPDNVVPIRRALGYLSTTQSLPDNVFLLPRTPSLEPEIA
jgi:hypothetical protein